MVDIGCHPATADPCSDENPTCQELTIIGSLINRQSQNVPGFFLVGTLVTIALISSISVFYVLHYRKIKLKVKEFYKQVKKKTGIK